MRLIKCDRCYATVDNADKLTVISVKKPRSSGSYDKELCGGCADALRRFVDEPPPKAKRRSTPATAVAV